VDDPYIRGLIAQALKVARADLKIAYANARLPSIAISKRNCGSTST
jgi:hypothetical protein